MRISIYTSGELRATIALLKQVDAEVSKQIRKAIRTISTDEWKGYVSTFHATPLQSRVLVSTANVTATNTNVNLRAGNSTKRLRGGGTPQLLAKAAEFGTADKNAKRTYISRNSRKGHPYKVTRRTRVQLPNKSRSWIVYEAAAKFAPRIASLYVQTCMKTFYDAIERGGR